MNGQQNNKKPPEVPTLMEIMLNVELFKFKTLIKNSHLNSPHQKVSTPEFWRGHIQTTAFT
jgi:hypothetical protein